MAYSLPALERLVIVSDSAGIVGGSSQIAITSARALAAYVPELVLIAGAGEPDPALTAMPNVTVHVLGLKEYAAEGLRGAANSRWHDEAHDRVASLLGPMEPEGTVVHVHSYRERLSSSVFAAAASRGIPTVYTAHDYSIGCPIGGFYNYRKKEGCGLHGGSLACIGTSCSFHPYWRKLWAVARYRTQTGRAGFPSGLDHVIFITEFSSEILKPYLRNGVPYSVVENPVESEQQPRRELRPGAPYLFIGRFTAEKDPLTVAEASSRARLPVTFAGAGELEEEIRKRAPHALMAGWQDRAALIELMRGSRALVFPSRLAETQGLAAYEAAAQGLPTICSDAAAASKMVQETGGGTLFHAGDAEDLDVKMRMLNVDAVCEEMSRAAYESYWSNPATIDRHVGELLAVYQQAREHRLGRREIA